MNTYLTNDQTYALILLIFYSLVKSMLHFIRTLNIFNMNKNMMLTYSKFELIFSDLMNIIFMMLSFYLIFMKNVRSIIYFFVCIILLFKGLLHFITDYRLYKYLNFDLNTQNKIEKFHYNFANITDLFIGLISLYLLINIYI